MGNMKKLVLLFSVVAVAFALQAGDSPSPKDKAAGDKGKAACCEKAKGASCDKAKGGCCGKAEGKGCCSAGAAKGTAKKPIKSPKDAGNS